MDAREFTLAPNIYPLHTSGTGLVGQQTSERPLCARPLLMAGRLGLSDPPPPRVSHPTPDTSEKIPNYAGLTQHLPPSPAPPGGLFR